MHISIQTDIENANKSGDQGILREGVILNWQAIIYTRQQLVMPTFP